MRKIKSKYLIPIFIICILCGMIKETAASQWKRVNSSELNSSQETDNVAGNITDTFRSKIVINSKQRAEYSRKIRKQSSTSTTQSASTTKRGGSSRIKSTMESSMIQVPGSKYFGGRYANDSSIFNQTSNKSGGQSTNDSSSRSQMETDSSGSEFATDSSSQNQMETDSSGSEFTKNSGSRNQTKTDSGSEFTKDSSSRNQTKTNSGSRFYEPTSSSNINTNNTRAEYVESEVVNFKRISNINPEENLSVAECVKGQYAPRTMRMYRHSWYHCTMACITGCQFGFSMYKEDPRYVPLDQNPVTCYLIKVKANYKIKRFKKVTRKGNVRDINECHCGSYLGPKKFRYCKNVNQDYALPESHPLVLTDEGDGEMRLACMNFCDTITSFISLVKGKPALVDCWPHKKEYEEIARRTFVPHGECVERNGDVKCLCGIPKHWKPTSYWEETLKRPEKNFRYDLNMTAPVKEKDDRVYDLVKLIYAPRFFMPMDKSFGDGYKSSSEKPLKYKKSKPPSGYTTSDMSEEEKQLVRVKGSLGSVHSDESVPPPNMRSYNEVARPFMDEDSVNQLAVERSWISRYNSERTRRNNRSNARTRAESETKNNRESEAKTKSESRTKKIREATSKRNKDARPKNAEESGSKKDEESISKTKNSKKRDESKVKKNKDPRRNWNERFESKNNAEYL